MEFDFGGWATKNDIKCSDGKTIRKDAFAHCDGRRVPLVWNHNHAGPENVLGYAVLENRPEGVYAYGSFNDTENAQVAKNLLQHGDIVSLSICANKVKENRNHDVLHGEIREVSLVLAGANDGAKIENVMLHSDDGNGFEFYIDEDACDLIEHAEKDDDADDEEDDDKSDTNKEKTIEDIVDSMNEDQRRVLYALVGQALDEEADDEDEEDDEDDEDDEDLKHSYEGDGTMKSNVFDNETQNSNKKVLTHAAGMEIIGLAKRSNVGSLKEAMEIYAEENGFEHDALSGGFTQTGNGNVSLLFPEYQDVRPGAPELITNDQGWIDAVLNKVHKSPISRIRTRQVDIRNIDSLRAKGYVKGKEKKLSGNFELVRRTTDPQTVYVKNALHRDDIVDIVDFDYVDYLYMIDKMMLREELAMAIMLGDGRDSADPDKISPEHIRPIWTDDNLYTLHVDLDLEKGKEKLQGTNTGANFGEEYIVTETLVSTVLHAREQYKGSGTPDLFCTPHMVNTMLLARDLNGRRIYNTVQELASALNVGEIHTCEQFEGKQRTTSDSKKKKLVGIIANLTDYSLGATKGGEVTHFTDFDIDFNQEKSLLETRTSGALTRVYSAIAIEEDITNAKSANSVG